MDLSHLNEKGFWEVAELTDAPLLETVRHINYLVSRMGIDHVAFGSDFDGTNVSNELKDVAGLPKLIAGAQGHLESLKQFATPDADVVAVMVTPTTG